MSNKILILGYGRHGKDTVAEILEEKYGLKLSSSSLMAAKLFLYEKLKPIFNYQNFEDCYQDRHNHRELWFQEISEYNTPDKTLLAKAIVKENDIYVGMRNIEEFQECREKGIFDIVVWVDASERVPYKESSDSCTVTPDLADYVINNNGTLDCLEKQVDCFWEHLLTRDRTDLSKYDKTSSHSFISTFSGNKLHFLSPSPDEVDIEDIINNLGNNCRYCGNVSKFYSVAEHCVIIAKAVLEATGDKERAFSALMHDASEAYLCDIPRPMKPYLEGYFELESKLQDVIFKKFNIKPVCDLVKWYDCNIVADEASVLFKEVPSWVTDYEKTGVVLQGLPPEEAKEAFRNMLVILGKY